MQVKIDGKPRMLDIRNASRLVEFTTALEQWIRDVEGFLLVYSITSWSSFASIKNFHHQIRSFKDPTNPFTARFQYHPIMLVGNKFDQVTEREVSTLEGQSLAHELGCKFLRHRRKSALTWKRLSMTLYA
jgi:GTPase KRas protein